MDLHRLRTFQALSETLHFRHAAERLGITQSAVSQQIASLEKELGAALFERIGRRVFLTAAGEVLAREAVKVLSTVSRAREAVLAVSKGNSGRLRVGASTTPGIYLVPEVLGRFRADFPLVELDFRIANSSRIEALAVANDFDLGVCGYRATSPAGLSSRGSPAAPHGRRSSARSRASASSSCPLSSFRRPKRSSGRRRRGSATPSCRRERRPTGSR